MNDRSEKPPVTPDDLAASALDAHGADEAAAIAAHVESSPDDARLERELRAAAGEFAAAVVEDLTPSPDLRSRVFDAARRRRPPAEVVAGASPIDVHRVELARALLLLRDLTADDWDRPVDPPELAGWTVHDVAIHLVANASLLARQLGVPVPGIPETADDNAERTTATRARHAGSPPARAVAELEAAAEAADAEVSRRGEERLDERIDWWGVPTSVRTALLVRAFETWTHADDIRRAVGADMLAPPTASLLTMANAACGFVPLALTVRGEHHPGRLVRFRFTDLGTAWEVDLGVAGGIRPAGPGEVDAEIVTEAIDLCRAVGARIDPGGLAYDAAGDERLAGTVVDALPALAVL